VNRNKTMLNYIHSQSGDEFTNVYCFSTLFKWEKWHEDERKHDIDSLKREKRWRSYRKVKALKLARQKHSREEMIFSLFLLK